MTFRFSAQMMGSLPIVGNALGFGGKMICSSLDMKSVMSSSLKGRPIVI